ncbi:MobA/MobL family protein [Qipengyuania sp. G39]|uniref:MobA/MobL family protein n=1 Tax=Qipengyuania profundimaris TaxID=3067652 RepID=A0ABT9HMA9_9SPHN|nr:MobA/MobL family protein [Qipengyuania sp. G39]MDP4573858.1 MobA/MobL family protein [Qipengyuania sp. G39]
MAEIPAGTSKVKGDAILEVDLVEGARVKKAAASIVGPWDRKRLPIRLSKGRGGRTQFRLTAEFPDGIDAAARVRITQAYCQYLAEFGVMYTAAIHAPDEHNDERNHHLHITYYDRPCSQLPDGRWDFEVREKVEGQHNRYRYPHRQPKISELARTDGAANYRDHRALVVTRMREHFADICNAELTKVGVQRQFDPGRYTQMGIEQEPTQPLGPRAAPLEAAGIATTVGMSNAEILWSFRLEQERKECEASRCERQNLRKKIASAAAPLEPSNEKSALLKFERELAEASKVLDDNEHEIAFFRTILEMAYARPEKVSDTCSRILATLDAGKGSARDRKDRALIEARLEEADGFFDQILAIQERSLGEINPIVDQVHTARKKIRALSTEVEPYLIADSSVAKKMIMQDQPISSAMDIGPKGEDQSRAKFDNLMDRILRELVVLPPTESQKHFTVRGISKDEYLMLSSSGFAPLAQARLKKIASIQHERVAQAIRLLEEHGHQTLADLAETESNARRALLHLKVYADHPLLKRSCASMQEPIVSESGAQDGPERGSEPIEAIPARSEKTDLIDLDSKLASEKEAANHARDLTIRDFVTFIRDNPGVIIEEHDGSLRLSRESAGDWKISADVFSEEPLVKEALADRARANLEIEQREAAAANDARCEQHDQRLRARIMKEIDCAGVRPVFWNGERWEVTTASADLAEIANSWQGHPDLQAAYKASDRIWAGRESLDQKKAMETVSSSFDLTAKGDGLKLLRDAKADDPGYSAALLKRHQENTGGRGKR